MINDLKDFSDTSYELEIMIKTILKMKTRKQLQELYEDCDERLQELFDYQFKEVSKNGRL